jgi:hypothetical protein
MQVRPSSSRFVSRRSVAARCFVGLLVCLACGGRAADGSPEFDPDGVSAGAFGGRAGSSAGVGAGYAGPPRPPRGASDGGASGSSGTGGAGGTLGDRAPNPSPAPLAPDESRCPQLPLGQVEVRNRDELEALRGCTSLAGDLAIYPFPGVDLTPLAQLERVGGALTVGDPRGGPPPFAFASLAGLESLRSVGALVLRGVTAPSLAPLSGLAEFASTGGIVPLSAYVFIEHCPALEDLQGLDNLRGLRGFMARSDERLVSLRGLRVPSTLEHVEISDSPVSDIGALGELTEVIPYALRFTNTALTNVADLARLSRVGELGFESNSNLLDIDGLAGLTSVGAITVIRNRMLQRLPEFTQLASFYTLWIEQNASLRDVPAMPGVQRISRAWVQQNPLLLRALALGAVEGADELYVDGNAELVELDLGRLAQVNSILRITHNPSLDASALPRPAGATHVIGGNLGDALGLDPCPWSGNGSCEGAPADDLCAAGTDSDCSSDAPL